MEKQDQIIKYFGNLFINEPLEKGFNFGINFYFSSLQFKLNEAKTLVRILNSN